MFRAQTAFTCFIAAAACFFFAAAPLRALDRITAPGSAGQPFFVFDIYQYGEQPPWEDLGVNPSDWPISSAIKEGIAEAAGYWVRILSPGARNTGPLTISVTSLNEDNAYAYVPTAPGGYTALSRPIITGDNTADGALAAMVIGDTDNLNTYETGPVRVLPANGAMENLQSGTVLHELGHALGIRSNLPDASLSISVPDEMLLYDKHLYNADGLQYTPGQTITWDRETAGPGDFLVATEKDEYGDVWGGALYFRGDNTLAALNGATLLEGRTGLPINGWEPVIQEEDGNWASGLEANHIELRNGIMSHQNWRNYGVLMEAELALMQDIGYSIDRKNFFGSSEYRDGQTYTNTNGYFARSGGQYQAGVPSTAQLGIGFHLYGTNNTITQAADLLADGWGGVGVRIDGWENTFTVAQGTSVTANGAEGTGLMVAYGKGHTISSQGDITALGPGGVAARFDFGSNVLSHTENRGSYIHEYWYDNDLGTGWDDYDEDSLNLSDVDGPLVKNFEVSGTLAGDAAAIFISENAYVKAINILPGARLFGDIISHWDPSNEMLHDSVLNRNELTTDLTFRPGQDSIMKYRGNILGRQSLEVRLADGGALAYGGVMDVLSFTAEPDASLLVPLSGARIAADSIVVGGTVGFAGNTVSYGAPFPSQWDLLRLESDNIEWDAAVQDAKNFIHGFHDYTAISLKWDAGRAALVFGSARTLSQERAAVSAVTAPTAIALQAPYVDLLRNAMLRRRLDSASPVSTSLWFAPAYSYSRRLGANHYTLNSPGFVLGADNSGNRAHGFLLGAGAYFSAPAYRSDNADIDAKSATAFVYGAAESAHGLHVDAFAALGRTFYEQRRSVHGERHAAEYAGTHVNAGLSLKKSVPVTPGIAAVPFAAYTFTRLNVGGYNEGDRGLFGLNVEKSRSALHRVELGSSFSVDLKTRDRKPRGTVEGKVLYSGLYGDLVPEADMRMTRDASGYSLTSRGWAQDRHSLVLGVNARLDIGERAQFSCGYTFTGGPNVRSHQVEFSVAF